MTGVLIGFAIIGFVIAVGYVIGRMNLLGDNARHVLSRIVFFVLSPCLLFTVLAKANLHVLFSSLLLVSAISGIAAAVLFVVIMRLLGRRRIPELVVGALASGYVNANNIGLPVAVYVLKDPAYVAPVLLLQLLVIAPVSLILLDTFTRGRISARRILLQPVKNPLLIASAAGALLAVFRVHLPSGVMEPFVLIGGAAIPVVLISFGMSLHGQRPLRAGPERADVLVASTIKLAVMPAMAYLVAHFVFGLGGVHLFVVVVLAALPTAQNVFNYAQRYQVGEAIARETVLITTVGAVPVLLVVAGLLGG